jgi:hypothetical protein
MLIIHTTGTPTTAQDQEGGQETVETGILDLLTDAHDPRPWAVCDLIREYDDKLAVHDALDNLQRSGLIHRRADVVFPSRAAVRFAELKW